MALAGAGAVLVWAGPDGADADAQAMAEPVALALFTESKDAPLVDARLSAENVVGLRPQLTQSERQALLDGAGVTFTAVVDGVDREITTAAETFADALAEAGVALGWEDEVAVDLSDAPVEGAEVRIARASAETVTEEVLTPYETERRESNALLKGRSRVVQEGQDGTAKISHSVQYLDGEEVERTPLLSVVVNDPVTEIIEVGTREPKPTPAPAPKRTTSSSGSSGSSGSSSGSSGGSASSGSSSSSAGSGSSGSNSGGESAAPAPSGGGSSAQYSLSQFMRAGVINWNGYKFTYYSQQVLPGGGLNIPGRHVNAGGYVADGDGYIVLANSAPKGTIINTPFGYQGKVYDRGTYGNHYDVYIR